MLVQFLVTIVVLVVGGAADVCVHGSSKLEQAAEEANWGRKGPKSQNYRSAEQNGHDASEARCGYALPTIISSNYIAAHEPGRKFIYGHNR